jgi:hypothetical protein
MDAQGVPLIPIALYLELLDHPPGAYGISYDIYTQRTEANLPQGWNSYRGKLWIFKHLAPSFYTITAATYRELATQLQNGGFHRLQYSDWICDPTDAADAYWVMLSLLRMQPPGKFQSTVKGIKLHHIANWAFDATHQIQLGGGYSQSLQGPTPAGLVPHNVPAFVPPQLQQLPCYTQGSEEAMDANNWRVSDMM